MIFTKLLIFFLPFAGGLIASLPETQLKVMTFNIRYDNPGDGENGWNARKGYVATIIKKNDIDIFGIQEGLKNQVDYLSKELNNYDWIGIGRDDGKEAGEYSAVFYKKDKFYLLESNTFWLSETPGKPGLGWDAGCNRIVTWGKFKDKITGKVFYSFNTHLDNAGETARKKGAELLKMMIDSICSGEPVIITGDFNSEKNSEPYSIITSDNSKYVFTNSEEVSHSRHEGPEGTFTGFDAGKPPEGPIDFIFVSKGIKVNSHKTLDTKFNDHYPSDHFPVSAEIILP